MEAAEAPEITEVPGNANVIPRAASSGSRVSSGRNRQWGLSLPDGIRGSSAQIGNGSVRAVVLMYWQELSHLEHHSQSRGLGADFGH